ncbi:hypothetical protein [Fulvivirga kasyanovii]|uniref:DUF1735 domain-containing protein n=1 Tax=Fulvivirga kasyanovii TaxID=396812 RepID=A0ABW9RR95_9BACT|nr:hypothetical protein [Fulvivirga kasyanovii]MTI26395.1 hypothetical protein [Fulvivirga kasyanovii]
MKNIYLYISCLLVIVSLASCEEDYDNPIDGLEQTNLFVQFAANTPEEVETVEGGEEEEFTVQVPISMEADLIAELSFSGDAEYGVDFDIAADSLVSASETGAKLFIEYTKTDNSDVVVDQTNFTIKFLDDAIADGDKTLIVTLTGAVGATDNSIKLDGGRGAIRKEINFNIADNE